MPMATYTAPYPEELQMSTKADRSAGRGLAASDRIGLTICRERQKGTLQCNWMQSHSAQELLGLLAVAWLLLTRWVQPSANTGNTA